VEHHPGLGQACREGILGDVGFQIGKNGYEGRLAGVNRPDNGDLRRAFPGNVGRVGALASSFLRLLGLVLPLGDALGMRRSIFSSASIFASGVVAERNSSSASRYWGVRLVLIKTQ
jgi:hypothetical protein